MKFFSHKPGQYFISALGVAFISLLCKKKKGFIIYFMIMFVDFIAASYKDSLVRLDNLILYSSCFEK